MSARPGLKVFVEFRRHNPDKRAALLRHDEVFTVEQKQPVCAVDGETACCGQEFLPDVAEAFDQFDRRKGEMAHEALDDPSSRQIIDAELDTARRCQAFSYSPVATMFCA